jgi:hypothetical protein
MAGAGRSISVAIASFNGGPYIVEQLASIAGQSLLPSEVIVSDDGSRDDTRALIEAFGGEAPFSVRLLPQPTPLGILENFYAAFAGCTGDIIAYCDQDDVWLPEKLERQMAALDAGAMLVVHSSRIVDGLLRPLGRDEPGNYAHGRLSAPVNANGVRAFGHQMLFRRSVLDTMIAVRPIAERLSPGGISTSFDRFIPFCASLIGAITVLPEPLILFRRHQTATSDAGTAVAPPSSRRAQAAAAIVRDVAEAREAHAIARAAIEESAVPIQPAAKVVEALRRRLVALEALAKLEKKPSRIARFAALPGVLSQLLAANGFSNQRGKHDAAIALIAAAG